jgi:hypothetical protein
MKFTICGSARFEELWHEWNKKLGLMGHISYSLMTFPSVENGVKSWYTENQKELLDLAHLAKIEESDAILVLNKDNYIGDSTRREINWAKLRGKKIFWLEDGPEIKKIMATPNGVGSYAFTIKDIPNLTGVVL